MLFLLGVTTLLSDIFTAWNSSLSSFMLLKSPMIKIPSKNANIFNEDKLLVIEKCILTTLISCFHTDYDITSSDGSFSLFNFLSHLRNKTWGKKIQSDQKDIEDKVNFSFHPHSENSAFFMPKWTNLCVLAHINTDIQTNYATTKQSSCCSNNICHIHYFLLHKNSKYHWRMLLVSLLK